MSKNKKTNEQEIAQIVTTVGSSVPQPGDVTLPDNDSPPQQAKVLSSLAGQDISIDLTRRAYFGVGDIWLSPDNYWCTVPDNMTSAQYAIIDSCLQNGSIHLGKTFIPPMNKASDVPEKYWVSIERNGFDNKKAKADFALLLRRGHDQGWTALEIVNFCLEKERAGKNRKNILALLTQTSKYYDGPMTLWDPPDTKEGIKKVIIKPDGTVVATTNSGAEVAKSLNEVPPKDHKRGGKTSSEAVNDIFAPVK